MNTRGIEHGLLKMKHSVQLQRRLRFLQVEFAIIAFIDAIHFIYTSIVGLPIRFAFLHSHVLHGVILWSIIALFLIYVAYLCRASLAAFSIAGYISIAIARFGSRYVVSPETYAPFWAAFLAGLGAILLSIGFWFRLKLERDLKKNSRHAVCMRRPLRRFCGFELWRIIEILLIVTGVVFLLIRLIAIYK